ncbi:MAG: hypothetical protein AVDCRST_MAG71-2992, partial [uncultured Lysobacter sp.]
ARRNQKKARPGRAGSGLCSLPHVGIRTHREGNVTGFARCSAKRHCR